MEYFKHYASATALSSNNQKFFTDDGKTVRTARSFYRLRTSGEHRYSFLFVNAVVSTFADGAESRANTVCDTWEILSLRAAVCKQKFTPGAFSTVTKQGNPAWQMAPGAVVSTDPLSLRAEAGDMLCLEISFQGRMIPYLHETLSTAFRLENGAWEESIYLPRPVMVGVDAPFAQRILFWGDSITEGLGTAKDAYAGYAQDFAALLPEKISVWNIGLGHGRGADAASGGFWYFEALSHGGTAFVCFGVNDILHGYTAAAIRQNLTCLVEELKKNGQTVILQTVPPFTYTEEQRAVWYEVNAYIKGTLAARADMVFDNAPVLSLGEGKPHEPRYGDHPNEEGCRLWAEALFAACKAAKLLAL